jgi:hypothetical protein
MNIIKKALEEVKYRIPKQLLEKVFVDGSSFWRGAPKAAVDEQILNLVIRPRVMKDCDIVGGTETFIPLYGLEQVKPQDWLTIIHIPKDRTNGRSITTVLDVSFYNSTAMANYLGTGAINSGVYSNLTGYSPTDNSAMASLLSSVVNAMDKVPLVASTRAELIAENTIMVKDGLVIAMNAFARCILAEDENLNNIPITAYREFAKLVEFAVKSYIYKELIILVDVGELRYGQQVGAFKDVYMSYSDAEQNYQDQLDIWQKVRLMADHESYARYLRLLIGPQR